MTLSLAHRGPDDQGIFISEDRQVALGHRRLSIIDLSPNAKQPMQCPMTQNRITYNGEIYNYKALRNKLIQDGFKFNTESDTEVILCLYQKYGCDCIHYLEGIFAFALYDAEQKSLFIARDPYGVKPLYYAQIASGFVFSSELKSLLQCREISRSLDYQAIDYTLRYLWTPAPHTLLESVKKLRPGYAMIISQGKIKQEWQYYQLPMPHESQSLNPDLVASTVKDKLSYSVSSQLVSDVPVGAFLSGGLDSSSIVALAKQHNPELLLPCFTIRFKEEDAGQTSDLPYAKAVAKQLGVPLNIIDADKAILQNISAMVYALDEPQADPAAINTFLIAKHARQLGIKVLLSGAGGDDIFTGYRRHTALSLNQYLMKLPRHMKKAVVSTVCSLGKAHPRFRRLQKGFSHLTLPSSEHIVSYFNWLDDDSRVNLYESTISADSIASNLMLDELKQLPRGQRPLNQMLFLEMKHFLADHNLNYTDKLSMAAGVEVRVPFLDKSLIQYASTIPLNMKQKGLQGKWILKKAMEGMLPKEVIYRSKTGFGVPLRTWMSKDMQPLVNELLSPSVLKQRGIFSPSAVSRLIQRNEKRQIDASYPILALMCIETWCQSFVDPVVPTPVSF